MSLSNSWWVKAPVILGLTGAIAASAYSLGHASKVPPPPVQAADYLEQGFQLRADGQTAAALDAFDQAIALNPKSAEAYTAKGAVFAQEGQTAAAIASFNQAIEVEPSLAAPYIGWSQILIKQGKFVEAKAVLNQARTALKQNGETEQAEVVQYLLPGY